MSPPAFSPDSDRFTVTYTLSGNEREALDKANDICYEQTVEFPEDLTPSGFIRDVIVGRIEEFKPIAALAGNPAGGRINVDCYRADISFAAQTAGNEFTQLLNIIFGNISLKPGIRVETLELPQIMLRLFRGPRFGRTGLRRLAGVEGRPLICTALKPMGLSPAELASQAYLFAVGGIDIIKDDHGLANQPFCPFEKRVELCARAVYKANRETGRSAVYMPNITAPADRLAERAYLARKHGAGALLVIPGLTGADSMRLLAADDSLNLPIVSHPAFWGSFTTCPDNGLSPYFLYGQLMRLAGVDAVVFPHYGGRFPLDRDDCVSIARGCGVEMGQLRPSLPVPGGGVTADRLRDMFSVYGREFILLIGGELHRNGPDLAENCRGLVKILEEM